MPVTTAGLNRVAALVIGEAVNPFDAANAHLGVGDSNTAFAVGQTDLQAAVNKHREIVDGAPVRVGAQLTWIATFETGEGNFVWREVGLFDAAAANTMFSRIVAALGEKVTGTWELTYQMTFSLA